MEASSSEEEEEEEEGECSLTSVASEGSLRETGRR